MQDVMTYRTMRAVEKQLELMQRAELEKLGVPVDQPRTRGERIRDFIDQRLLGIR